MALEVANGSSEASWSPEEEWDGAVLQEARD